MYSEEELVAVARRENNKKRKYLVVNKLQGKHIPVLPSKAFAMFYALGELIKKEYAGENLLIIGFAETATAIGAALAVCTDSFYMQTTRENVENMSYLYFTESHSHATEQKLVRESLESVLDKIDRIVFAEDEITTGNTILKIVNLIKEEFHATFSFSAASILNGMDKDAEELYKEQNISCHYLVKTHHDVYTEIAARWRGDGVYVNLIRDSENTFSTKSSAELEAHGYQNARCITKGKSYQNACEELWQQVKAEFFSNSSQAETNKELLILGTEEFMYPALYVAAKLEETRYHVKFHATTRSPIVVSTENTYPLHERFELRSLYDKDRVTYVYELKKYDEVLIFTDAKKGQTEGISSLVNALRSQSNTNIHIIRWCRA